MPVLRSIKLHSSLPNKMYVGYFDTIIIYIEYNIKQTKYPINYFPKKVPTYIETPRAGH